MSDPDTQSHGSDAARGKDDLRGFKLLLGVGVMLGVGIAVLGLWLLWRISNAITAQLLG